MVYPDTEGAALPELELRPSAEDPALTELVVDGAVVAVLPSEDAPALDAILLVGESEVEFDG